jgi:hypothetical protein
MLTKISAFSLCHLLLHLFSQQASYRQCFASLVPSHMYALQLLCAL